jgi:SAM-dependent methyltransferase
MALPADQVKMVERLERSARYQWATQVTRGRKALDVGCEDGSGTATLAAAGASCVLGIDSSDQAIEHARVEYGQAARFEIAEPVALPVSDSSFDLVTGFGVLERSDDPDAVLDEIERVLEPSGVLLASLSHPQEPDSGDPAAPLMRRFRTVSIHRQAHYAGTAIDWEADRELIARTSGSPADTRQTALVAASDRPLPPLEPCGNFEPIRGLEALLDSLSQWEERARDAEAEVAAMRWEVRIAGEKLVALVQRLVELENAPTRRLRRWLRSEPVRVSAAGVTRAASGSGRVSASRK